MKKCLLKKGSRNDLLKIQIVLLLVAHHVIDSMDDRSNDRHPTDHESAPVKEARVHDIYFLKEKVKVQFLVAGIGNLSTWV